MRFQPELSTYSHFPQRKKKEQKERNDYSFSLLNPEGTIHVLLKGDILTSYEQYMTKQISPRLAFILSRWRLIPAASACGGRLEGEGGCGKRIALLRDRY